MWIGLSRRREFLYIYEFMISRSYSNSKKGIAVVKKKDFTEKLTELVELGKKNGGLQLCSLGKRDFIFIPHIIDLGIQCLLQSFLLGI